MTSAVPVVYDEASHSSHAIDSAISLGRPALCHGIRSVSSVFQGSIGVIVGPLETVNHHYAKREHLNLRCNRINSDTLFRVLHSRRSCQANDSVLRGNVSRVVLHPSEPKDT